MHLSEKVLMFNKNIQQKYFALQLVHSIMSFLEIQNYSDSLHGFVFPLRPQGDLRTWHVKSSCGTGSTSS